MIIQDWQFTWSWRLNYPVSLLALIPNKSQVFTSHKGMSLALTSSLSCSLLENVSHPSFGVMWLRKGGDLCFIHLFGGFVFVFKVEVGLVYRLEEAMHTFGN